MWGLEFIVSGLGFKAYIEFRVRVWGREFWVSDLRFRAYVEFKV